LAAFLRFSVYLKWIPIGAARKILGGVTAISSQLDFISVDFAARGGQEGSTFNLGRRAIVTTTALSEFVVDDKGNGRRANRCVTRLGFLFTLEKRFAFTSDAQSPKLTRPALIRNQHLQ